MGQTREETTQNLAERLGWAVARRDDSRVARRLYRKQGIARVYRRDEGAVLDDFVHFLQALGVRALFEQACGAGIRRERVPFVQYVWLYGLTTLLALERINALPRLLVSAEALMQLVGINAQQGRHGVCQRGATKRQGERASGPSCPDTLAKHIVQWNRRDLAMGFNGAIGAWAAAGVFGAKVRGIVEGTDVDTTDRYTGCGEVTRKVPLEDTRGQVHELEVTVDGWKVLLLIDAVTKIPVAVQVGQIQEHEARWARALGTQARMNLGGDGRLAKVVFEKGFWDGSTLWWLAQQARRFVVPAKTNMAVTAEARAPAAAGADRTVGRRVHTVRQGQGTGAWRARLETEVVGITGLTTSEQ